MKAFEKKPISVTEQINLLTQRGLIIDDVVKAEIYLKNISYYRLSAYWYTFLELPQSEHIFKPHSNFKDVINTYIFDRKLRFLIFEEIERIEIALRSQIIYHYCHEFGNNWYEDKNLYTRSNYYYRFNELIQSEIDKTNEVFIRHYKSTYHQPENPPAWMILELASFGQISMLYKNLRGNNRSKREIAKHFGVTEKVLESWLECLAYVRNSCAHHMRLWNRKLPKSPLKPQKTDYTWISNLPQTEKQNRIYLVLVIIQYLLKSFIPESRFGQKIVKLIENNPTIPLQYMGFPENWKQEKIWQ